MKDLWKHIAECKNQECPIPHCVSSRYVLSHYHKCTEPSCDVCKPVRDAIARHHQNRAREPGAAAGPGDQKMGVSLPFGGRRPPGVPAGRWLTRARGAPGLWP